VISDKRQTQNGSLGVRPWANRVQPSLHGCHAAGCRGKQMSIGDILSMDPIKRREKAAKLEEQVQELQTQLDGLKEDHSKMITKLNASLVKLQGNYKALVTDSAAMASEHHDNNTAAIKEWTELHAGAANTTEEVANELAETRLIHAKIQARIGTMRFCGCKGAASLGQINSSSPSKPDMETALKVSRLETEKQALEKAIDKEMSAFTASQTRILDSLAATKVKLNLQAARAAEQEEVIKMSAKRRSQHSNALEGIGNTSTASLTRAIFQKEAAQQQLNTLEAAMARCGCGPRA